MRCDQCKHWKLGDEYQREMIPDLGKCERVTMFWDATAWTENYERRLLPEHAADLAFVQDASDYSATFLTRAGFFCAQWEAKP